MPEFMIKRRYAIQHKPGPYPISMGARISQYCPGICQAAFAFGTVQQGFEACYLAFNAWVAAVMGIGKMGHVAQRNVE